MNLTKQEIVNYLTEIIEHGSHSDLLELYCVYTGEKLTLDQINWEE